MWKYLSLLLVLASSDVRAGELQLGQRLEALQDTCSLHYKGTRGDLDIYACGWIATPWGERFAGVAVDARDTVQEIILVNGSEADTRAAREYLEAQYHEPQERRVVYPFWKVRNAWICVGARPGGASAIEITTRRPRPLVTFSASRSNSGKNGKRYIWDPRLGGNHNNGSHCRDPNTGRIVAESNCR